MRYEASPLVESSVRVYRVLLWLYPADHREEYGWLMVQLFRDKAYDAYSRDGDGGIIFHWLTTILDLVISVIEERRQKGFTISFNVLGKVRNPLLLSGGFLVTISAFSYLKPGPWYRPAIVYDVVEQFNIPGFTIFGVGLLGAYIAHRKIMSRIATIGLLFSVFGLFALGLLSIFEATLAVNYFEQLAWEAYMGLLMVIILSLAVFGISMTWQGYRFGWLSVVPLVSFTAMILVAWLTGMLGESSDGPYWHGFAMMFIKGATLVALGCHLGKDLKQEDKPRNRESQTYRFDQTAKEAAS